MSRILKLLDHSVKSTDLPNEKPKTDSTFDESRYNQDYKDHFEAAAKRHNDSVRSETVDQ